MLTSLLSASERTCERCAHLRDGDNFGQLGRVCCTEGLLEVLNHACFARPVTFEGDDRQILVVVNGNGWILRDFADIQPCFAMAFAVVSPERPRESDGVVYCEGCGVPMEPTTARGYKRRFHNNACANKHHAMMRVGPVVAGDEDEGDD